MTILAASNTKPEPGLNKQYLSFNFAKKHGVLLTELGSHAAVIHRANVTSQTLVELRRCLKRPLHLTQVTDDYFNECLTEVFATSSHEAMQIAEDLGDDDDLIKLLEILPQTADLLENEDAPIIQLLNALFTQAIKQNASDIHIETYADKMLVRFRIDGILRTVIEPSRILSALIISRIKIMAKLDIAEKRLPQDGRISIKIAGHLIDVRVSILPANHGERAVLRLLDQHQAHLNLHDLGMSAQSENALKTLIRKSHGMILVTGPTGSGKTTTLYALLSLLNDASQNILTVEDPIEYDLPGIGQTAVNYKTGMTFAKGLRAILRQDPDVVMVGEIRDLETAQIAVQASLTGHLVLSTLHTNTAIGAITRLRDMGIEPFLLSSCLLGVVAQRLVRLLCPVCKRLVTASVEQNQFINAVAPTQIYEAGQCEHCGQLGYSGRSGIYELFTVDENLRQMIHDNTAEPMLANALRKAFPSIRQDGVRRVLAGETTIAEIVRVTSGE